MLKTIIIEDEVLSAEKLRFLIAKIRDDIEVEAILPSVADAVKWLKANKADLIFMDMHLRDGKALEIFQEIKVETPIIFTTAYDQYALEAFKEFGIDYLMKPIVAKDLERAFHKFDSLKGGAVNNDEMLNYLVNKLKDEGQKNFLVNSGKEIKIVPTKEIACIYADGKSVYLLNTDGLKYLMDTTLDKVSTLVPKFLFRANRKAIINLHRISSIENHTYGRLLVTLEPHPHFEIIVPLERVSGFKASITDKR
ncbi:MAG: LytTR family DNA-binding domain-containing protein [Bacteroidota bacterium]